MTRAAAPVEVPLQGCCFQRGDFLTASRAHLYTHRTIRLLLTPCLVALCACATTSPSRAEFDELQKSLRAMREANGVLESRLERLERERGQVTAARSANSSEAPAVTTPSPSVMEDSIPALKVVKLKPKKEAVPPIRTQVAVVEPPIDILNDLAAADDASDSPTPGGEDVQFERGLAALKTGELSRGVESLDRFANEFPKHAKADNAIYFSGLGLLGMSAFDDAAKRFEAVVKRYPAGDAVQDAMLRLAECRIRTNKPAEARAVYEKILKQFPGSAAANVASTRLSSATMFRNEM